MDGEEGVGRTEIKSSRKKEFRCGAARLFPAGTHVHDIPWAIWDDHHLHLQL